MEALLNDRMCEVCWHELADPIPQAVGRVYLPAAFYSTAARRWLLCERHMAEAEQYRVFYDRTCSNCHEGFQTEYERAVYCDKCLRLNA